MLPVPIYGTRWILLLAYIAIHLPSPCGVSFPGMSQLHPELEEAVRWQAQAGPFECCGSSCALTVRACSRRRFTSRSARFESMGVDLPHRSGHEVFAVLVLDMWEGGNSNILSAYVTMVMAVIAAIAVIASKLGRASGLRMIRVHDLAKRFPRGRRPRPRAGQRRLRRRKPRVLTLLGPSGCGKEPDPTLRCRARRRLTARYRISATTVYSRPRATSTCRRIDGASHGFPSYAIWPHMTVSQNVRLFARLQRQPNVRPRTMAALEATGLAALADRYSSRLSGGQHNAWHSRERLSPSRGAASRRASVESDAALREQMVRRRAQLHERLRITTLFVTHDQGEARRCRTASRSCATVRFVVQWARRKICGPGRERCSPRNSSAAPNVYPGDADSRGARPSC